MLAGVALGLFGASWAVALALGTGARALALTCGALAIGGMLALLVLNGRRRSEDWSSRKTLLLVGSSIVVGWFAYLHLRGAEDELLALALALGSGFVILFCLAAPRRARPR